MATPLRSGTRSLRTRNLKAREASAEAVEEEVEGTETETAEEAEAPAKTTPRRSVRGGKAAAKKEEAAEETDGEEAEAPAKTTPAKGKGKAAAKTADKKVDAKPAKGTAKNSVAKAEKKADKVEDKFTPFSVTTPEGGMMVKRDVLATLANRMECSLAEAERLMNVFEETFTQDIMPHYSFNLFGVRFKRKEVEEKLTVGCGGLSHGEADDARLISEHVEIRAKITVNRFSTKGKVDGKGKFKATGKPELSPASIETK